MRCVRTRSLVRVSECLSPKWVHQTEGSFSQTSQVPMSAEHSMTMSTLVGQGPLDASRALQARLDEARTGSLVENGGYLLVEAVDKVLLGDRLAVRRDLLQDLLTSGTSQRPVSVRAGAAEYSRRSQRARPRCAAARVRERGRRRRRGWRAGRFGALGASGNAESRIQRDTRRARRSPRGPSRVSSFSQVVRRVLH